MKGTVRKPRTAGGTWSYRIDTGLDDRGRRRPFHWEREGPVARQRIIDVAADVGVC